MDPLLDLSLRGAAAIAAGGAIGWTFGWLQQLARRRHEQLDRAARLPTAWSLLPGSGARVGYLLLTLALVQVVCPLLFSDRTQWLVSAGLLAGYGLSLATELRQRLRAGAP
ncbi:MAG: hypothetical protein JSR48_15875 [Verrucomicrobia bacterium]|nr:hypothetical protein [Verrucomicrobiota bacterium]